MRRQVWLFAILSLWALPALGHGGGLDRYGCHTNRKTGDYHCHRAPATGPPPAARLRPAPETPTAGARKWDVEALDDEYDCQGQVISETELVLATQRLLGALGYLKGAHTGLRSVETEKAIRRYQRNHGLSEDGHVSGALLTRLSLSVLRRGGR